MRVLYILVLTVLGIAMALHAAFGAAPAVSPVSPGERETEASPQIVFDETAYDFGTIGSRQTVKHIFKFRNVGDATLVIEKIETTCGCTGTLLSNEEILSGGEGNIETTFKSGRSSGRKKAAIHVYSNDPQQPIAQLYIMAHVVVPVEVRPRSLYWPIDKNMPSARTVELLYQPDINIKIVRLELSSPRFKATARPKNEGETPGYEIDIRCDGNLPVGDFRERLTIVTDSSEYPKLQVAIGGRVMGLFRVVPNAVTLGIIEDDMLPSRAIRVYTRDKEDFEITGVESTSPLISTEFTRDEVSNEYEMKVTLTETPPTGLFSETLLIETNNLTESPLEVTVTGYVR